MTQQYRTNDLDTLALAALLDCLSGLPVPRSALAWRPVGIACLGGVGSDRCKSIIDLAVHAGLVERIGSAIRITDRGFARVARSREIEARQHQDRLT